MIGGFSCNYIESLLGIETLILPISSGKETNRCNYIESLLGIETPGVMNLKGKQCRVATILNPY